MFVQLGLEALKQREGIRRTTSKSGQYPFLINPPYLARTGLDDNAPKCHLTIPAHRHKVPTANGKNGRTVVLFHKLS